ncbi:glycosyltransferase [Aeoliella mucimassa]|uniref:Glycosyltransferase EpsD n=1 Tax=Aeoliella mucimassa TaxID=2527972 RepID=A0A518ALS7_9BACT|nr:glycosyltransferase [Aeoliella mucimassa]QDU55675.1 Putative glycosyltransferase EpsD [Aeoliella mucimassa]
MSLADFPSTDSLPASSEYALHSGTAESSKGRHVVHITSSRFYGGPERQMLELARELSDDTTTSFISFAEGGLCDTFLQEVRGSGFRAIRLHSDTPHLIKAAKELTNQLKALRADVVITHGYKAGLLGLWSSRQLRLPVVAVSRGWTAETWKVRVYEKLDRWALRKADAVVCVSNGQAQKVKSTGAPGDRLKIIHNAIRTERFNKELQIEHRQHLETLFPSSLRYIIGAAGRLSPEKGFDCLIDAVAILRDKLHRTDFGVVLFGEGALHDELQKQLDKLGLADQFVLAGFTSELDMYMPHFDLFVQSSHTEGLPNVLLEAAAAGVPVIATDVGGTSEVVDNHRTGVLVHAGDATALANELLQLLEDDELRNTMRLAAPQYVREHFTFASQATAYRDLFRQLTCNHHKACPQ